MSRSLNRVQLIGNLGRDAETAYTQGQTSVTKFSVATERRWKDRASGEWKSETDWHNVVAWRIENLAPYLTKGTKVYVEGRLQTRTYEKEGRTVYVTEIVSDDIILLGSKNGNQAPVSQPRSAAPSHGAEPEESPFGWGGDDVPF